MENLNVYTKKMPSGEWSCYTTYKGIDKAFVGKNISVVIEMFEWLKNEPVNIIWNDPVLHDLQSQLKAEREKNKILIEKTTSMDEYTKKCIDNL